MRGELARARFPHARGSLVWMSIAARALGAAVIVVAATACSNPKCWTHDASEVSGGCSLFGGSSSSSGSRTNYDEDSINRNYERQLAEYGPACDRGEPVGCWMVGDARYMLSRPAPEIEAAYAVACRGGLAVVPYQNVHVCDRAADAAGLAGGSGRGRAYREIGCLRGSHRSCAFLFEEAPLPSPSLELATAACELGNLNGCWAAVSHPAANAEQRRSFMIRGCAREDRAMCAALGRREVAP